MVIGLRLFCALFRLRRLLEVEPASNDLGELVRRSDRPRIGCARLSPRMVGHFFAHPFCFAAIGWGQQRLCQSSYPRDHPNSLVPPIGRLTSSSGGSCIDEREEQAGDRLSVGNQVKTLAREMLAFKGRGRNMIRRASR